MDKTFICDLGGAGEVSCEPGKRPDLTVKQIKTRANGRDPAEAARATAEQWYPENLGNTQVEGTVEDG